MLVASDVAPADMMRFKRSVFTGFVTDVGGRTSHTAIVARSMDIPAVVGAREASRLIRQDDWVGIQSRAGETARGLPQRPSGFLLRAACCRESSASRSRAPPTAKKGTRPARVRRASRGRAPASS